MGSGAPNISGTGVSEPATVKAQRVTEIVAGITEDTARRYCRECGGSDPGCSLRHYSGWTPAIVNALAIEFCLPGSRELFSNYEGFQSEFLLDVVLLEGLRDNRTPKNIRRLLLGAEIEWTEDTIELDFNKLLCFSAPLKVFIYECTPARRSRFKTSIRSWLESFAGHVVGEFLIIEFFKPGGSPRYRQEAGCLETCLDGSFRRTGEWWCVL